MHFPGLVIAGTHSGVGKTTISMGLMGLLSRRMPVQPFKVGPDYIDPAFHTFITGRHCRNLDGWLLDENTLRYLYAKNGCPGGIGVVEGVMGLFDGAGSRSRPGSTAHIAEVLKLPVVLVVDGRGMSASAAAMVLGYRAYDPLLKLRGVLFNNVKSKRHFSLLREAVERDTGVRVVGYMPQEESIRLPSRHLGLVPREEVEGFQQKLDRLVESMEETVEVEALLEIAREAEGPLDFVPPVIEPVGHVKLAVAHDRAFHFYYRDNLELLQALGAELFFFSPLEEASLPTGIDGIYIGGGFPEVFARELEAGEPLKKEIAAAAENGMPIYGECGGLMYLSEGIYTLEGGYYNMAGVFPGKVRMTGRLQRFGYVELQMEEDNLLGRRGERVRAHEFHHSRLEGRPAGQSAFQVYKRRNGNLVDEWRCGVSYRKVLASYPHIHFYSNLSVPSSLLRTCLEGEGK